MRLLRNTWSHHGYRPHPDPHPRADRHHDRRRVRGCAFHGAGGAAPRRVPRHLQAGEGPAHGQHPGAGPGHLTRLRAPVGVRLPLGPLRVGLVGAAAHPERPRVRLRQLVRDEPRAGERPGEPQARYHRRREAGEVVPNGCRVGETVRGFSALCPCTNFQE